MILITAAGAIQTWLVFNQEPNKPVAVSLLYSLPGAGVCADHVNAGSFRQLAAEKFCGVFRTQSVFASACLAS